MSDDGNGKDQMLRYAQPEPQNVSQKTGLVFCFLFYVFLLIKTALLLFSVERGKKKERKGQKEWKEVNSFNWLKWVALRSIFFISAYIYIVRNARNTPPEHERRLNWENIKNMLLRRDKTRASGLREQCVCWVKWEMLLISSIEITHQTPLLFSELSQSLGSRRQSRVSLFLLPTVRRRLTHHSWLGTW